MAQSKKPQGAVTLEIPLDASGVEDFTPDPALKVVARSSAGLRSATVKLDKSGKGTAKLSFDEPPRSVQLHVGPDGLADDEIAGMDTLTQKVPARVLAGGGSIRLTPILIPPFYWYWWLRWCRVFTVRGRVVCADGTPVPAAEVCAFDMDGWAFWHSKQQVGCATTDQNGAFEIRFRWCCGLWPWYWWRRRVWEFDPDLAKLFGSAVRMNPDLAFDPPGGVPSLKPFATLLRDTGIDTTSPLGPDQLDSLERVRLRLLERLPQVPELERLHIWPFHPWYPWRDCHPDLVFRVTQDCGQPGTVIVDEGWFDTRWNVPTDLTVTLVANDKACCIDDGCQDPPCDDDECLVVTSVCGYTIDQIGGNLGAPAAPVGYARPGAVTAGTQAYNGDRPFGGSVNVVKNGADTLGVDYYEIEYDGGSGWTPLPFGWAHNITRAWLQTDGALWTSGAEVFKWDNTLAAGHSVIESREHFEANGPFNDWFPPGAPGSSRFWTSNKYLLMSLDSTKFADGTYRFRVIGWDLVGGALQNPQVIPLCGTQQDNELVLTFDNRVVDSATHDPTHLCGSVHTCTTEPDTHFVAVRINGQSVGPCETVPSGPGTLEIDFMALDPDEHLGGYSLIATYGLNQSRNLLNQPGSTVTTLVPGLPSGWQAAPASSEGTYGVALAQGAVAPHWRGGSFRLTVPLTEAFPEPCCYQLELRAWKRTVVSCSGNYDHRNLSEYTLGVGVCP
ncbi:MAG: carboxypeptidase regulatory-like domain-containing protein [Gemmatimonadetes bacterium]|nr:carboxypeptidase regulatory-like domain-containing protein [Gemmatimonadota bacterium]